MKLATPQAEHRINLKESEEKKKRRPCLKTKKK